MANRHTSERHVPSYSLVRTVPGLSEISGYLGVEDEARYPGRLGIGRRREHDELIGAHGVRSRYPEIAPRPISHNTHPRLPHGTHSTGEPRHRPSIPPQKGSCQQKGTVFDDEMSTLQTSSKHRLRKRRPSYGRAARRKYMDGSSISSSIDSGGYVSSRALSLSRPNRGYSARRSRSERRERAESRLERGFNDAYTDDITDPESLTFSDYMDDGLRSRDLNHASYFPKPSSNYAERSRQSNYGYANQATNLLPRHDLGLTEYIRSTDDMGGIDIGGSHTPMQSLSNRNYDMTGFLTDIHRQPSTIPSDLSASPSPYNTLFGHDQNNTSVREEAMHFPAFDVGQTTAESFTSDNFAPRLLMPHSRQENASLWDFNEHPLPALEGHSNLNFTDQSYTAPTNIAYPSTYQPYLPQDQSAFGTLPAPNDYPANPGLPSFSLESIAESDFEEGFDFLKQHEPAINPNSALNPIYSVSPQFDQTDEMFSFEL